LTNSGYGSALDLNGDVSCDASIMTSTGLSGALTGLKGKSVLFVSCIVSVSHIMYHVLLRYVLYHVLYSMVELHGWTRCEEPYQGSHADLNSS